MYWTFNEKSILAYFDSYRVSSMSYGNRLISTLNIMSRKPFGEGVLKCFVKNKLGSDISKRLVRIRGELFIYLFNFNSLAIKKLLLANYNISLLLV